MTVRAGRSTTDKAAPYGETGTMGAIAADLVRFDDDRQSTQLQLLYQRTADGQAMVSARGELDIASRQQEPIVLRELDHVVPQLANVFLRFLDVLADAGTDLDDGLVHLRLDLLFENPLALGDDLAVNVRTQIASFWIDGLVFLFNTDSE